MLNTNDHQAQVYGFSFESTEKILKSLKNLSSYYVNLPHNLDRYLNLLVRDNPQHILGLGSYSGVDQEKIRIETICSNKFRNDFIGNDQYAEANILPFLSPTFSMKFAKAIGNSYCNLVSWKIMQLIENGIIKSQYTFLHIPKSMKTEVAEKEINTALEFFWNS